MKVYIAGKITGDKHYERKFRKVEKKLRRMGYSVMNPAWLRGYPEFDWKDYMAVTAAMQERCEAVLFLPDWTESKGARLEHERAQKLNQSIYYSLKSIGRDCK